MAQAAIAQAEGVVERHPNAQRLVKPPEPHEQELHALTHTPYAPWCSSCLKHRARPDQHRRSGEARDMPIPVISMDFAVTKKKEGLDPHCEGAADDKGALWLVLTDSRTYLGVVPIESKGQLNYMTHEVLSFVRAHHSPDPQDDRRLKTGPWIEDKGLHHEGERFSWQCPCGKQHPEDALSLRMFASGLDWCFHASMLCGAGLVDMSMVFEFQVGKSLLPMKLPMASATLERQPALLSRCMLTAKAMERLMPNRKLA